MFSEVLTEADGISSLDISNIQDYSHRFIKSEADPQGDGHSFYAKLETNFCSGFLLVRQLVYHFQL